MQFDASRTVPLDSGLPRFATLEARMDQSQTAVSGQEHWTRKGDIKLFLWEKAAASAEKKRGTVLFVHGSSMASQPTFDLQVPGRPHSSAMDWFARQGFDTWCFDMEGYGRSDKHRDIEFRHRERRRRHRRRDRLHHENARREEVSGVWDLVRAHCARRFLPSGIPSASGALRSMRSYGPGKAAPRLPNAARSCRSSGR